MKRKINWRKFALIFFISLPVLLLIDIAYDAVLSTIVWDTIFSVKNLCYKGLAALVLAYFFSTFATIDNGNINKKTVV